MTGTLKARLQRVASSQNSRRQLREEPGDDDEAFTKACENKIYDYNQCTGVTDESAYYFDDIYYDADDPSAECAYLLNGGSCAELVDDGDASCTSRFFESVECYYSAVCGQPVKCSGEEDPFSTDLKPITFYNVFPSTEKVCFFFGNFLEHATGPLAYGETITVDAVADESLFVGYGRATDSCEGVVVENSHSLGVYVSDVNTYGVGVADNSLKMGPKAWRSEVASDPDSTIFVHEARGYDDCKFQVASADLGLAVNLDDGVAQDLKCNDYTAGSGIVTATCDGQTVQMMVDASSICARASQQFMAIGDKSDPGHFPLQLFLVQANERCDYLCSPSDTFDEILIEDELLIAEDEETQYFDNTHHEQTTSSSTKKSNKKQQQKKKAVYDLHNDAYATEPARSILTVSLVSMIAGLCCGCALAVLAVPFYRRRDDDEVEINKKALRQPLLEAAI